MKIIKSKDYQIVEDFLNRNFSAPTHWPDWNLVVSKHYKTEFFYYIAIEKHEIVGICPVHKTKKGILSYYHSGQFHYIPYGGWLLSNNKSLNKKFFSDPLGSFISFCLPAISTPFHWKSNKNKKSFYTLIIDLKNELDDIWKNSIDSKRRNMIRKAEKSDIFVSITNNYTEDFYNIYLESCNRNSLNPLTQNFFKELFDSKNIKFKTYTALKNKEVLANIVIAYDKDYAIYWLGNNANNTPNLGQGELIQWTAIQDMKNNNCLYYDLCYIEKERLPNIYKFKKGFTSWEVDVPFKTHKPLTFKVFNRIQKWF